MKPFAILSGEGARNGGRLEHALRAYRSRHRKATRIERTKLLDESCQTSGYHRKYAIALLNQPEDAEAD